MVANIPDISIKDVEIETSLVHEKVLPREFESVWKYSTTETGVFSSVVGLGLTPVQCTFPLSFGFVVRTPL